MTKPFHKEDFVRILKENGVVLNVVQLQQFETYMEMLRDWNQRMNLTAITDPDEIYQKHFLDSVIPSFHVRMEGRLCDVGSGAGFPSIPLKIVYPELQVTILEPIGKRVTFLKALCDSLGIQADICKARAEDAVKSYRGSFDIVTARAVANLTMLCELCIPFVKRDGIFLAMKGSKGSEELDAASYAVKTLGCVLEQTHEEMIYDVKRMDFVFRKVADTPGRYPRNFAQMKKNPLQEGIV